MLSAIMLSVIMLSVIMLSVIMLSVVMLNVIILNVEAPTKYLQTRHQSYKKLFFSSVTLPANKLECLPLENIFRLTAIPLTRLTSKHDSRMTILERQKHSSLLVGKVIEREGTFCDGNSQNCSKNRSF
jgi:hypothetical protein